MTATVGVLTVVHRLPGRLRLRYRAGLDAAALVALVSELAGVTSARANRRVRSLTLTYDPAVTDGCRLVAAAAAVVNACFNDS